MSTLQPVPEQSRAALRSAVVQQVGQQLGAPAEQWEVCEFERHGRLATRRDVLGYKARVAEVKAALRRLPELAADVKSGRLSAEDLAEMSGDALTTEEARRVREQERLERREEHFRQTFVKPDKKAERQELLYYKHLAGGGIDIEADLSHSEDEPSDDELEARMRGLALQGDTQAQFEAGERWQVEAPLPALLQAPPAPEAPADDAMAKLFASLPSAQQGFTPSKPKAFEVYEPKPGTPHRLLFPGLAEPAAPEQEDEAAPEAEAAPRGPALADLTVPQLKAMLKARQLPVSGKKEDLVKRLQEDDEKENPQACLVTQGTTVVPVAKAVKLPGCKLGFQNQRLVLGASAQGVAVNGQPLPKGQEVEVKQTDVVQCGLKNGAPGAKYQEYEVLIEDAHRVHELLG